MSEPGQSRLEPTYRRAIDNTLREKIVDISDSEYRPAQVIGASRIAKIPQLFIMPLKSGPSNHITDRTSRRRKELSKTLVFNAKHTFMEHTKHANATS